MTCKTSVEVVEFPSLLAPWKKFTWRWFARAIGPDGEHIAAQSDITFKAHGDSLNKSPNASGQDKTAMDKARAEIISKLLSDGWEPLDTHYYNQSFRKKTVQSHDGMQAEQLDHSEKVLDLLKKLEELKEANVLSEAEYAEKARKILSMK